MNEWQIMTFREAGVVLIDCVHKTPAAVESGFPYVTIPQMKDGRIDFSDARRISPADFIEWTKKARPQVHDVVLSRRTNPGVTATFGEHCEFALGQNLVLLRADGRFVCPEFLRWLVVSPAWWSQIKKYNNVGAVFDSLKCGDVPHFELPIPPKHDQKLIASILGALDDKIDLNRRMNETLEAMARDIFNDWFVNFGPTRAKMEGQKPYLAKEIWDRFPNRLDVEGKPEGWKVKAIGEVVERLPVGKRFEQKTVSRTGKVPVFDQGKTGIIGYHDEEPGVIASRDKPVVVFANHTCYMRLIHYSFSTIQNVLPFIGLNVDTIWVYYATIGKQPFIEYKGHWPDFVIHKICVPDQKHTYNFSTVVRPLLKMIWSRESESQTLVAIRDLLLPKLMSGEIRVKDAERIVEAAL